jgi:hypothetical protein
VCNVQIVFLTYHTFGTVSHYQWYVFMRCWGAVCYDWFLELKVVILGTIDVWCYCSVLEEFVLLMSYWLMQQIYIWNISHVTEAKWRHGNLNVLIRDRTVKTVVQRSIRFRTSDVVPLCPMKSTFTNRILKREYAERRPHNELLTRAMHRMISPSTFRPTGLVLSLSVHCSSIPIAATLCLSNNPVPKD